MKRQRNTIYKRELYASSVAQNSVTFLLEVTFPFAVQINEFGCFHLALYAVNWFVTLPSLLNNFQLRNGPEVSGNFRVYISFEKSYIFSNVQAFFFFQESDHARNRTHLQTATPRTPSG